MSRVADALVVGGGVVGCAVAWSLAREGVRVTLLERDTLAAGASGAAAGMLLPYGEAAGLGPFLTLAERSLGLFPDLCAELHERSGVDPELELCGALHVAGSEARAETLRAKAETLGGGLEWLDAASLRAEEPGLAPGVRGAVWSPREGHVRSPRLTLAFARAAEGLGARIERGVPARALLRHGARVEGVLTPEGPRRAGVVVLCGGVWTPELVGLPVEPVRGQILSLDNASPPLRHMAVGADAYLVPKRDGSVVVGATEERAGYDAQVTAAGVAELLAAGRALAPALGAAGFRGAWAGLRPCAPDPLPIVGAWPGAEGLAVATAHGRNGVLLSPVTGRLIADGVLGKGLPDEAAALRPERFRPA